MTSDKPSEKGRQMLDEAKMRKDAEKAVKEFMEDLKAKGGVEAHVKRELDGRLTTLVASFLGFEKRWSNWEVDHCNGRAGNSFVGTEIRQRAIETAEKVIGDALKNVRLTNQQREAIRKEYREQLAWQARDLARSSAAAEAAEALDRALAEATGEVKKVYDAAGNEIGNARYSNGRWTMVKAIPDRDSV